MQKQTFPNIYNLYQIINHIDNTKIMLSTFAIAEKTPLFPAMRVGILPMSVKKFRDSYPSSIVYKFKDDNLTFSIQSLNFFCCSKKKIVHGIENTELGCITYYTCNSIKTL